MRCRNADALLTELKCKTGLVLNIVCLGAFLLLAQAFLGRSARTDALTATVASGASHRPGSEALI
jgi:hypothetical protein